MAEPYCLAMVLCDYVHRDRTTGKCTILGTFSTFAANQFPAAIRFSVYFAITDGLGETTVILRVVESGDVFSESASPIVEAKVPITFENPLIVFEGNIGVACSLPKAGVFHCELLVNNGQEESVLMSRRIIAIQPDVDNVDKGE